MNAYDIIAEKITRKKGSWILWVLFNVYLLMNWVDITGLDFIDILVLVSFWFVFMILIMSIKHKKGPIPIFDYIFVGIMLALAVLPIFVPWEFLPFQQLPVSKKPFNMYHISLFMEFVLIRNIMTNVGNPTPGNEP